MNNKFYITTAIAYPNANPHIGFAYELFLADVIARYKRIRQFDTFFLTGLDEHGLKIARAAEDAGITPQEFVDEKSIFFKNLNEKLNISYDQFIRTSDEKIHVPGANLMWQKLVEAGDIYKKKYTGFYCVGCENFITEKELVDGMCAIHNKKPEKIEEENYFFKLSKYEKIIKEKIESNELQIIPASARNEMLSFLSSGLEDVSFSRKAESVKWGIPVPDDNSQYMYVWCDALTNYISAIGYGRDVEAMKKYWPADAQVIGKDIVRFHAIFWPAMLISAGLLLPKIILVHGFLTSEGKKMSKSLGNVVDPIPYIEEFGVDPLRHYLAHEISPFDDSDFSKGRFIACYNANLANGIGNLVSRTTTMALSYFDGKIGKKDTSNVPIKEIKEYLTGTAITDGPSVENIVEHYFMSKFTKAMDNFEINKGSQLVFELVHLLDRYVAQYEPYKMIKIDREKTEAVLWSILFGLYSVVMMMMPFMPETADKILKTLNPIFDENKKLIAFNVSKLEQPLFPRR